MCCCICVSVNIKRVLYYTYTFVYKQVYIGQNQFFTSADLKNINKATEKENEKDNGEWREGLRWSLYTKPGIKYHLPNVKLFIEP